MAEDPLAAALASALLAGPWTEEEMTARVRETVGVPRAAWPGRLAAEVLTAVPVAPVDAPRRFAAHLARSAVLAAAVRDADRRGRPLRVVHLVLTSARMGRNRFGVPPLDGLDDLAAFLRVEPAELEWFADVRSYQRRAPGTALHHYRYRWLSKRGAPRLLEAPKPRLRELQRRLLREVLNGVPVHPAAHGFVAGRSAVTGASAHTGAPVVARFDLSSFFATVTAPNVYGRFRGLGYPEAVAHALTGLTTHRAPVHVLSAMPPGGSPGDRTAVRLWWSAAHLPQGAPTSPALANLCAAGLDRRLAGLARALDATFTRYADDLTFSGGTALRDGSQRLERAVVAIAAEEGFTVNPAKTVLRGAGSRQVVTGIVVNERPNVARDEFDRLKALLHNCVVHGPGTQDRQGHPDFRGHLAGRVGWFEAVNPEKARRLRERFDAIVW